MLPSPKVGARSKNLGGCMRAHGRRQHYIIFSDDCVLSVPVTCSNISLKLEHDKCWSSILWLSFEVFVPLFNDDFLFPSPLRLAHKPVDFPACRPIRQHEWSR